MELCEGMEIKHIEHDTMGFVDTHSLVIMRLLIGNFRTVAGFFWPAIIET